MAGTKDRGGGTNRGKAGLQKVKPYNLKARVVGQLRRLFLWHPGLKAVRDRTRVERGKYRCEGCAGLFGPKEMRCDHVEPVVELTGFRDWNTYISRMFDAIPDGIQHLCKPCHQAKSNTERLARRKRAA